LADFCTGRHITIGAPDEFSRISQSFNQPREEWFETIQGGGMSLDFYLTQDGEEVFSRNITHNLTKMAAKAGIYEVLWRPYENLGITKAVECVPFLSIGLLELVCHRREYEALNSPNGWGMYEHFLPFVLDVLTACCDYPQATVKVSI
jgi:hypothetical protein